MADTGEPGEARVGGPAGLADGTARSPGQKLFLPLRPGSGKEGRRPCRGPHPLAARRGPPSPVPRALAVRAGDAVGLGRLRHADGIWGMPADGGAGTGGHHGGWCGDEGPEGHPRLAAFRALLGSGVLRPHVRPSSPGTRRDAPRHQPLVGTLCPLVVGVRRRRPAAPRGGGGEAVRTRTCRHTHEPHRTRRTHIPQPHITPVHASPLPHTHTHTPAFAKTHSEALFGDPVWDRCDGDQGYPSAFLLRRGTIFTPARGGPDSAVQRRGKAAERQTRLWRGHQPPLLSQRPPRVRCGCAETPLVTRLVAAVFAPRPRRPIPSVPHFSFSDRDSGRAHEQGEEEREQPTARRAGSRRGAPDAWALGSRPQPRQRLHGPSAEDPSACPVLRPRSGLFPPASRAARRRSPPHPAARDPSFRPRPPPLFHQPATLFSRTRAGRHPACPFQPKGRFLGTFRPPAARWRRFCSPRPRWECDTGHGAGLTPPNLAEARQGPGPPAELSPARPRPRRTRLSRDSKSPSRRLRASLRQRGCGRRGCAPRRASFPLCQARPCCEGLKARRVGAGADRREGLREAQVTQPPRRGGGGTPGGSSARTESGAVRQGLRSSSCEERGRKTQPDQRRTGTRATGAFLPRGAHWQRNPLKDTEGLRQVPGTARQPRLPQPPLLTRSRSRGAATPVGGQPVPAAAARGLRHGCPTRARHFRRPADISGRISAFAPFRR
ncbi:serine/arginine repetitive matrix protein 1-like [Lutra lutra]|uniref:serine/arginine repetitive matrix protein 1-like n=1 Tax=Lutra lutra TaxID=9657 RepID=UPI001FD19123|nr:serine/arginine repetitive matrix protein 1-like [Lutra lutra]